MASLHSDPLIDGFKSPADLKTSGLTFRNYHFVNSSESKHCVFSQNKQQAGKLRKWKWTINLSLSSQLPSGIVGRPGTLKWLAWRFCAVLLDTIQTSFLLSGLLHSLEQYSVMHLATRSFQWCSSLSLICEEVKQETSERLHTEKVLKYAVINKSSDVFSHIIHSHVVRQWWRQATVCSFDVSIHNKLRYVSS